ncbi:MAG: hypothetical protein ACKO4Y_02510 [Flavobacteriales bacterium]
MFNKPPGWIIKCIVILFFTLGLFRYYSNSEPYATGDGIEYILTTEAWYNHGTPNIKLSDFNSFKTDFIAHQPWESNYKAAAFDEVERYLKESQGKTKANVRTEFGGFYRNKTANVYGYHFVFYSLLNVPSRCITDLFDVHPIQAFTYTNLAFWILVLTLILFLRKPLVLDEGLLFLAAFFSAAFYYNTWTHPELTTVVLLMASFLFLNQERVHLALLTCALATLQNQPLVFLLIWMYVYVWSKHQYAIKALLLYAPYGLIIFIPSLYFYALFGTTSLIKDAGFLSVENISLVRIIGFYTDLNQGMILSVGLFLLIYIVLLVYRGIIIIKNRKVECWDLMPFVLLLMTLLVSAMNNWNHGMAIVNRYAVWIAVPLLFHVIHLMHGFPIRAYITMGLSALVSQVVLLSVHLPYNRFDWSNLEHMPIAKWVLHHHPSWYNPDPQIFIARTNRVFDFTENSSPVVYFNNSNELVKLAVHVENLDTLSVFGYKMNPLKHYPTVRSGKETWLYINDMTQRSYKSKTELLQLIEQSEVQRIINEMRTNPQWMKELTQKATRNHVDLEEQLKRDAKYIFNEKHPNHVQN